MTAASGRRLVRNRSGLEVHVDIDRDMDEATFDRMVAAGDLTPVEESKPRASAKK